MKANNNFFSITYLENGNSCLSLISYLPPSATIDSIPKMEEVLPSVEVKFLVSASSFLLEGPHYFGKEGPTSDIQSTGLDKK